MAQLVKRLMLDLSSVLDFRVVSSSLVLGSTLCMEPALKKNAAIVLYLVCTWGFFFLTLQVTAQFARDKICLYTFLKCLNQCIMTKVSTIYIVYIGTIICRTFL